MRNMRNNKSLLIVLLDRGERVRIKSNLMNDNHIDNSCSIAHSYLSLDLNYRWFAYRS